MNNEDKRKVKIGIAIAAFAVLLFLSIQHMDVVVKMAGFVLKLFSPFIFGVCLAFVLNLPMKLFEQKVFRRLNQKNKSGWNKARRPVCLIITVLLFLGILTAVFSFIIPQLVRSVSDLTRQFPDYMVRLTDWANRFLGRLGIAADFNTSLTAFIEQFSGTILEYVTRALPQVWGAAVGITSGVVNVFLGFVICIYMLAAKESLTRNGRRLTYAFLPAPAANYASHIYSVINRRFGGFVSGQLTEAFILAMLCFLMMNLFGWGEYALLISIIIGITNIVPIIGPIIGTIPGALIILVSNPENPLQAILFVAAIIVLQQIESNLIYPRVVGESIGLPGLWVLFAVLVGGGLFGLVGVLLGVPTFAVIYTLLSENVKRRLQMKEMKE